MIRRVLPLLCLAALACPGPATPAAADPVGVPLRDSVPHITTTGQASASMTPDRADIRLGVSNEKPSADEAAAATAAQASAVVDAIKAQGIAAADIRTSFSLAAEYDSATDPQTHAVHRTLRGYSAGMQITVRLRDVAKAGGLARTLIDKGANSFQGIDYSYSKETELQRRLDGEAARDAELAAHASADALGLKLGRVLQIGEDPTDIERSGAADLPSRRAPALYGTAVVIPTEPGTQTVTRRVTVIFEIEGKAR